jgi:hypothetical protein
MPITTGVILQLTCSCIFYKPDDNSIGSKFVAMSQTLLCLMKNGCICLPYLFHMNVRNITRYLASTTKNSKFDSANIRYNSLR